MTQQEQVLNRLKKGWTTALDALSECGCMRLAGRVQEFKQEGFHVVDKWVELNGKRFKAYKVVV
jgi:hypothetical protein